MKTLALVLLLTLSTLSLVSCGAARAQAPAGGNEIFSGHYLYSSWGQLASGVLYFENGTIDADGAGHITQCGAGTYNGVAVPKNYVILCAHWVYNLSDFKGTASSDVGDKAFVFCTATGKVCQYTSNITVGWSWTQRIERE